MTSRGPPLALKVFRSAHVPVTLTAWRLIREANRARKQREWGEAARLFGEALRSDPSLAHIWLQLGHARKELGELDAAADAYRRAAELLPDAAEPLLHLGHVRKITGDGAGAARFYMDAAKTEPNHLEAISELHGLVDRELSLSPSELAELMTHWLPDADETPGADLGAARAALERVDTMLRGRDPGGAEALAATLAAIDRLSRDSLEAEDGAASGLAVVFDVSDLISYFSNARLPTGIQRVQIETITSALLRPGAANIRICCFSEKRDDWLEVRRETFLELARLSLRQGDRTDPAWIGALYRLYLTQLAQPSFVFPRGAFLVNLGTSWWLQNYFLFVRDAKRRFGVRYVPFVHDMIPILFPEHCTKELTQDFISWALGVFQHADHFLTNSEATKRDLTAVAATLGSPIADAQASVIRLDADFRKPTSVALPRHELSRWGLGREPFVLFVATVESRKNHVGAFDAWLRLVHKYGRSRTPRLVCVGNRGWLNDAVYARLAHNEALRDRVIMLSQLSDDELALLYRSCLFTLYPSNYEGWGLPVTESLCYGKVPLLSNAASLPEAGGPFGVYFESGSVGELVEALETLIFDVQYRRAAEQRIEADFAPRCWADIEAQIEGVLANLAVSQSATATVDVPGAILGAYYPLVRNRETRIWPGLGAAEIYRSDTGWWWPDDWGCWTKPQGGELALRPARCLERIRAYLRLRGLPTKNTRYEVADYDGAVLSAGVIEGGQSRWIVFDTHCAADGVIRLRLRGDESEDLADVSGGLDRRRASVGLHGFCLCDPDDLTSRQDVLEAISIGDALALSAYRERPRGAGCDGG